MCGSFRVITAVYTECVCVLDSGSGGLPEAISCLS